MRSPRGAGVYQPLRGVPPRDPHPPDCIHSKRRISGVGCSGKPIKHAKTRINQQLDILSPPRPPQAPQATPRNRQRRSKCRTGVFRTPFCTPLGRPDPRNIVFSLRKTDVFKKSHFSLVRCAKMTQDAPRHPETLPKRATDHSKTSQRRPKMSPRRPKGRSIRPKGCQRHPKRLEELSLSTESTDPPDTHPLQSLGRGLPLP